MSIRSNVVRAVVVRTKYCKKTDGMAIRFDDNAAVIINAENNPRGTRLWTCCREIRGEIYENYIIS
jgi:large subunit ribosomal protein L14